MKRSSLAGLGLFALALASGPVGCSRARMDSGSPVTPGLSGDGSVLVRSAVEGGGLELWRHSPLERMPTVEPSGTPVAVALDGSGQQLTVLGRRPGFRRRCLLEQWTLPEGRRRARAVGACEGVELSADGSLVAVFGGAQLEVYETERLRPRLRRSLGSTITAVAFSPDARSVLVAQSTFAKGGRDQLWNVEIETGQPEGPFEGHQVIVKALVFLPDGSWVSAGVERRGRPTVHRWLGQQSFPQPGVEPDAPFTSVALSSDGSSLAAVGTLGCDSASMLWTIGDGTIEVVPPNEEAPVRPRYPVRVVFSPQGERVVMGTEWATLASDGTLRDVRFEDPHTGGVSLCSSPVAWPR